MNEPVDLSGLDADDAATATALHAAFGRVTLDRPSPLAGSADEQTAAALQAAFGAVTLDRSVPVMPAPANLVALPSRPRGRSHRTRWFAVSAAAVIALTLAFTLVPGRESVAWASEPTAPTAVDARTAQDVCGASLGRGLGELQQSGSSSVDGSAPQSAPATGAGPAQPTALPPLAVLDVRGDGALAVYQDQTWQVVCLLKRENGTWVDQGISVGPGSAAATPGLVFSGGTAWVGGGSVAYLGGTVPAGASRVTFQLSDGTTVVASLLGTTFAAWFPGDGSVVRGSLAAYDAKGTRLS